MRKSEREKIGYGHEVKEIVNSLGPPRGFFLLRLSCFGSRMLGQRAVSRSFLTGFRLFQDIFRLCAVSDFGSTTWRAGRREEHIRQHRDGQNLARQRRGDTRAKTDKMERIHVTACCSMNPPLLITSIVLRSERMFVDNDQIMSDTDLQE